MKYQKINTKKIFDKNSQDFTRIFSTYEVEKVNPVEYYKTFELERKIISLQDSLNAKNSFLTSFLDDEFFVKKAEEALVGYFEKFESTQIHNNFFELLKTTKKNDQEKLLRGMSLNPEQLMAFIFKSYNDFGFLYSTYVFENLRNGMSEKKLPKLFYLKDDGTIKKVGETDLSDAQLKNIIEQRKVIVSHFFEKDDIWHCIFVTYKSISGQENHNNGQPHFHYISSGFAISKEVFIESMRIGKYKSTKIHIDLLEYGKQLNE